MKKLIFFGLLSFLLATIWLTPLAFVIPHLSKITTDVTLEEPSGTLWKGRAKHLTVQDNYLGKISWDINPLQSLKTLSLKTNFTLQSDDINANGLLGVGINKNILINNTTFDVNAAYFNSLQKDATLSGNFNGFVKDALLTQNEVPVIDGIVNWQNGAVNLHVKRWAPYGNFKLEEGDYRAVIKPEDQNLDINLTSKEAPIELNGNVKLQKDWVVNTDLSTKSSNAGLMAIMKLAGKPQQDGTVLFKQTNDLKPFINMN